MDKVTGETGVSAVRALQVGRHITKVGRGKSSHKLTLQNKLPELSCNFEPGGVKLGEPLTSNTLKERGWVSEKNAVQLLLVLAKSNPDSLSFYLSCSDVLAVHHFFKHLTCFALVVTGDQVVGVVHRCGVNSKPVYQP